MKTVKFTSAIATLSLVLFMSLASTANSDIFYSGDLSKSGKSLSVTNTTEKDLSYLRFDINKFMNENETEVMELPVADEFDYLRFEVNNFTESYTDNMTELPVNEFDYLRFDVNNFTESATDSMIVLPVNEFDYLRFNVNNFAAAGNNELPLTE